MRTRFAGWLVCGPLGHLVAGVADWVVLVVRWQLATRRARLEGCPPRDGDNPP